VRVSVFPTTLISFVKESRPGSLSLDGAPRFPTTGVPGLFTECNVFCETLVCHTELALQSSKTSSGDFVDPDRDSKDEGQKESGRVENESLD